MIEDDIFHTGFKPDFRIQSMECLPRMNQMGIGDVNQFHEKIFSKVRDFEK